jgi:hypothetical protein
MKASRLWCVLLAPVVALAKPLPPELRTADWVTYDDNRIVLARVVSNELPGILARASETALEFAEHIGVHVSLDLDLHHHIELEVLETWEGAPEPVLHVYAFEDEGHCLASDFPVGDTVVAVLGPRGLSHAGTWYGLGCFPVEPAEVADARQVLIGAAVRATLPRMP